MAHIQRVGNLLIPTDADGTQRIAVRIGGGIHLVSGEEPSPDPTPDPTPDPGKFRWPFDPRPRAQGGTVSSEYGYRPQYNRVHQGIDFAGGAAANNNPIPAAFAGVVYRARWHNNFGNHVVIDHGTVGGSQLFTLYAHLISPSPFSVGARVSTGQTIGRVGNTGNSFGAHLHWETHVGGLRWTNPGTHRNPREFMKTYGQPFG